MIVDRSAYLFSLMKVYGTAAFLVFVLPLAMWRDYLKTKSYSARLLFCLLTQEFFLINLVLFLGFLGICSPATVAGGIAAEYALIRWSFSGRTFFRNCKANYLLLRSALRQEISFGRIWLQLKDWGLRRWKHFLSLPVWHVVRANWFFILLFTVTVVYNVLFLNHNTLIYHSYQFSDLPVHHSWVYGLEQGDLFSGGIYPFGMHAIIYCIRALSRIDLREIILYFGSFQTVMMIFTLFLFSRKVFQWKYTAYLVLLMLSLMFNQGRYAASLPQECGVFALFSTALFLLDIFGQQRSRHIVAGDSRLRAVFRFNQYLSRKSMTLEVFLLMISVALVISFHFYTAIATIVLSLAIVLCNLTKFLKKQYFVPIFAAAALGAFIAVLPLAACYAKGTPFHDSMGWALSLVNGTTWEGTGTGYLESLEMERQGRADALAVADTENDAGQESPSADGVVTADEGPSSFTDKIKRIQGVTAEYWSGFLFNATVTRYSAFCLALSALCAFLFFFWPAKRAVSSRYISLLIYILAITVMGNARALSMTVILDPMRASVFLQPAYFILLALPFDIIFSLLALYRSRAWIAALTGLSFVVYAGFGYSIIQNGLLHAYFDVNLAYYNEPDYLLGKIRRDFPRWSYTVVSPTEEYYATVTDGFHTELSEMVSMIEENSPFFKFPTKYVFIFIEKYTLQDFYDGPAFVSREYALRDFYFKGSAQDYYYQRNILESKAWYWAKRFMTIYPNSMQVYFEDDIYIAYLLTQDVNAPLDLRCDYLSGESGLRIPPPLGPEALTAGRAEHTGIRPR